MTLNAYSGQIVASVRIFRSSTTYCNWMILRISCLAGIDPSIIIEDREYVRYCGNYYVSVDMRDNHFCDFWDFIGSALDSMSDYAIHERVYALFVEHIQSQPSGSKIVDFGVGTGLHTKSLLTLLNDKSIQLFGVDVSEEMVRLATNNGIVARRIIEGHIPFPDDFFDVLISCFVLHLYDESFSPFKEWFRTLRNSGRVIFNHPPFSEYSQSLKDTGFSDIQTSIYRISTPSKNLDIWITCATKP